MYTSGIKNREILCLVGTIITIWPHIEEKMVILFGDLTGIQDAGSARLVFRCIINQRTRIAIMKGMLEKAPQHKTKGQFFDELIQEYTSLSNTRNDYAHGLWYTHEDGVRAFLETETETYESFLDKREVTAKELESVLGRINTLLGNLLDRSRQLAMVRALEAWRPEQPAPMRGILSGEDAPHSGDELPPTPPQSLKG